MTGLLDEDVALWTEAPIDPTASEVSGIDYSKYIPLDGGYVTPQFRGSYERGPHGDSFYNSLSGRFGIDGNPLYGEIGGNYSGWDYESPNFSGGDTTGNLYGGAGMNFPGGSLGFLAGGNMPLAVSGQYSDGGLSAEGRYVPSTGEKAAFIRYVLGF